MKDTSIDLSILIVSDIHENIENVDKLVKECKITSYSPDYIFVLGDIVTIQDGKQEEEKIIKEKEKLLSQIISKLENISDKVIYIPGNHDPKTFYSTNHPKLSEKSTNLHMKNITIGENLVVYGLGGSISNFYTGEGDYHKYNIENYNNIIWLGYPYINDRQNPDFFKCEEMLNTDLLKGFEDVPLENNQIILISHSGPFSSTTSTSIENNQTIYSGSFSIDKLLMKYNKNFLANCHGHTHKGKGMAKLGLTDIINPGALKNGDFSKLNLKKDKSTHGEWRIEKIEKLRIN